MEKIGIGINVIIFKDGRILLGKRKGTGEGEWGLPGGKLEFSEHFHEAALREVKEETGIELKRLRFVNLTNDPRPQKGEHYVHVNFEADTDSDAIITEPDHFSEWAWFDLDRLPVPIFFGHRKLLEAYKKGELLAD